MLASLLLAEWNMIISYKMEDRRYEERRYSQGRKSCSKKGEYMIIRISVYSVYVKFVHRYLTKI